MNKAVLQFACSILFVFVGTITVQFLQDAYERERQNDDNITRTELQRTENKQTNWRGLDNHVHVYCWLFSSYGIYSSPFFYSSIIIIVVVPREGIEPSDL